MTWPINAPGPCACGEYGDGTNCYYGSKLDDAEAHTYTAFHEIHTKWAGCWKKRNLYRDGSGEVLRFLDEEVLAEAV